MRSPRELLAASKEFACENRLRSWAEILLTCLLAVFTLSVTLMNGLPVVLRIGTSLATGLLYVRLFVIYHDYQHRAILCNSAAASILMNFIGIYLLAPRAIWVRSHEHHHNNNSKLTIAGIGSYPTISKARFLGLTRKERAIYLINRHPLTIIFGHFTLFIYWLNMKSFVQSPRRHIDSIIALLFHATSAVVIAYYFGITGFILGWFTPFFMAFGIGSYLFYCQHNFPGAKFKENPDWTYVNAALTSTSRMIMNPVMTWFTGNIGYHPVHHVNSRIPFYRLREAWAQMPELKDAGTTSWHLAEVVRCFQLKLWDPDQEKMITLKQL